MLNCTIIDDDAIFLELMKRYVQNHPELVLHSFHTSITEAWETLMDGDVDLLLLDIEMPGTTGLDLVKSLEVIPQVIFITAHSQYAVDAYNYDVTDYVVKPITADRFNQAINKAFKISQLDDATVDNDYLFFKNGQKNIGILPKNIVLVEAYGDYIKLYENETCHLLSYTLNSMQQTLGSQDFMRIHRKYLINLNSVVSVEGANLQMSNGSTAQVSRTLKNELKSKLRIVSK